MAVARYKDYACKQGGKLMIAGEHLIAAIVCFKKKKKRKKIEPVEQSICSKA